MRVIMTHEQADFDALGSLLAASLLDEGAFAVLPRRINRNVRAFLNVYGSDLPFLDANDLPPEPIGQIFLVDTQSMVSLKGMHPGTSVYIVDHHPLREDLPKDWEITIDQTGANVTLLVEDLQQRNGSFSMPHATLLMLGIYEDTGSLTYSRTTPRDLLAAAFLLEHGANLNIAAEFLSHPLSPDQQKLYEILTKSAEILEFHGHRVILAQGDATEIDEELSTIAHKLRDFYDPDGLFVVVQTRGGVQIIARSTNDHVDVGKITALYGGGGHARAAAALVRERSLVELMGDLRTNLEKFITPSVRVSEIMSWGLRDLKPDTLAKEAAEKMRRYGYEGYPVVDGNQVIGLLTRRAVDRAIAHGLNLPASSLMSAGSITIAPADSIDQLQKLMAESGWGQIPVRDSVTQTIVGIVTRTDLIKTLVPQDKPLGMQNLRSKLENVLPEERLSLLEAIREEARIQHIALYIVGGFVRDLLLERPGLDFDLVVEGDGIQLAKTLAGKFGGRITTHHQFGTAKWYIDPSRFNNVLTFNQDSSKGKPRSSKLPEFLDFISARTEFYTYPTALPTVETGSIKLDLHRRDFTINTLALRLDGSHYGELHDYWGGMSDIRKGVIRVLHSLSFVDDPTRMLRAVRFEQRFGFRIDDRTLNLLSEALSLLGKISGDRIRHELDHCFSETNVLLIMSRLHQLGLLKAIHPELSWDEWSSEKFSYLLTRSSRLLMDFKLSASRVDDNLIQNLMYTIWLIRLSPEQIGEVCSHIRIPAGQVKIILAASQLRRELPIWISAKPSQITSRLDDLSEIAILAVCLSAESDEDCRLLEKYLQEWRYIRPSITGEDIRQAGVPAGPIYKTILSKLRSAWLDGDIQEDRQESEVFADLIRYAQNNDR